MFKKYGLLVVSLSLFGGNLLARDWKEKVAEESIPKVVILDIYGTSDFNMFGISFGRLPVHGRCSGVYINEEGEILTAKHCVDGDSLIVSSVSVQTITGKVYEAKVEVISVPYDLSLLKSKYQYVNHKFPYAKLLRAENVRIGQDLLAIGHPLDLFWSISTGIVSYVSRLLQDGFYSQFDAVIAPGSSGGPVFNKKGELIGIVSRYRAGPVSSLTGLNFMVGPPQIRDFLQSSSKLETAKERLRRYRLSDIK